MPVRRERVEQLLEKDEHDRLDHKRKIDLSDRRDVVELTKDIAAMLAKGGDILVGTDDQGRITGELEEPLVRRFDEAGLRDKLDRYLAPPFDIRVGAHQFDAGWVVAIHVEASVDGIAVIASEGSYEVQKGSKPTNVTVFRPGDVFVRHGSKSERWKQSDVREFIDRIRAREKQAWLREHGESSAAALEQVGAGAFAVARLEHEDRELARTPQAELRWEDHSQRGTEYERKTLVVRNVGAANMEMAAGRLCWRMTAGGSDRVEALSAPRRTLRPGEELRVPVALRYEAVCEAAEEAAMPRPSHMGEAIIEAYVELEIRSLPYNVLATTGAAFERVKPRPSDAASEITTLRRQIIADCYTAYMKSPSSRRVWRTSDGVQNMAVLAREAQWLMDRGYIRGQIAGDLTIIEVQLTSTGRDFAEDRQWTGVPDEPPS